MTDKKQRGRPAKEPTKVMRIPLGLVAKITKLIKDYNNRKV